ncbi:protein IQ-DOMAIN 12 [Andrographis paniculata]|uniref:protein IQ-DOMAIN 12 n=1 Tax=Andrographis paniculata TaxID=175694 RepID=UPI0021E8B27A|nr:protein IQ-DOMAIN 12 [Andrographis paniculata]XP_051149404.1 protein IQ-DOMAIN 12 [Andrographis paniculata]XP_051149410.1 protein IQ-DOMAIN 12 [Andrographis paniculata]XP_051149419.1 protein IQ-DOMAIN 12 [Andrographis paniculata]
MGKKKSWFTYVKRLFISESRPKSEESSQKPKKWGWFFERFNFRQCPALEAPQEAVNKMVTEEQRKHALAVAIATAAAAEAAVAAANAAAEVVRLTSIPYERKNQYMAAIKIQSTYRRHLAKKALNALKGLVKLQAVIRGELIRRTVVRKMPSMSWILKQQSQVHKKRIQTPFDHLNHGTKRNNVNKKEACQYEEFRHRCNSHKSWDLSLPPKEELGATSLQKREGIATRGCMKQYSFSQREIRNDRSLQEPMKHKEIKNIRLDKLVEAHYQAGIDKWKSLSRSNTVTINVTSLPQLKQKPECKQELNTIFSQPRRSFCHVRQKSMGDDGSLPDSPVFPAYMAATKSTKAKARSLSTPKQRLELWDMYSGELSPSKPKLSSWSSFSGEITKSSKRNSNSQHKPSYYGTLI